MKKLDIKSYNEIQISQAIDHLSEFISDSKKEQIETVLRNRTKQFTVVLDDIFQPHNASAVIRTAECLGIQDVYIIEDINKYKLNKQVVMGSYKWIDMHKYKIPNGNTRQNCMQDLRENGYKIVATTLSHKSIDIHDLPLDQKYAFVFGNEKHGVSNEIIESADEHLKLPMYGFTQSYNISVSAAMTLFFITEKMKETRSDWKLSPKEYEEMKLDWYLRCIKNGDVYLKEFFKNQEK
jgi:tRNA (guanosine-2'-O-)-methyltransferase